MTRPCDVDEWRTHLRSAIRSAMVRRDAPGVSALRSVLGAIDNAGAVATTITPHEGRIAGAVDGLGAAEAPRRDVDGQEIEALLREEITERLEAAAQYDELGQADAAQRMRLEAAAIEALLLV